MAGDQNPFNIGNYFPGNLFGSLFSGRKPPKVSPFQEMGRPGTAVFGGYVENIEKDPRLAYQARYRTASDMLANVSIVAAGLRFFLNLVAVPEWSWTPAEDLGDGKSSDAAKKAAEFAQDVFEGMDTSWTRVVRRSGMYRFHGFQVQEWIAKKRPDGMIGLQDIEQRPQHTIERWELADDATITGMWQRWPQNGALLFLPRPKCIYTVDDTLTDSPEGMGLFRHLVDPAERIRSYLRLEAMGFERDLRGLPVGYAPLAEIQEGIDNGSLPPTEAAKMLQGLRNFLQMQVKGEDTSIMLDSATYHGTTADGDTVSTADKWKLDLLTASATGMADLGKSIDRVTHDMARILGVESLLLGSQGSGGNRALSEDKSRNLYLSVNSTVGDIAESMRRDGLGAIWKLNGLDSDLMPKASTEDVAFKDVAAVAAALANMAMAGAVLQPGDPAINDVRDLLGISREPEGTALLGGMVPRVNTAGPGGDGTPAQPNNSDAPPQGGGKAPKVPGPEPVPPTGRLPRPAGTSSSNPGGAS